MSSKKILLFGGSFDPPHIGHMNLLRNAVQAVQPNLVLVIPSSAPPHKHSSFASKALRRQMCACFNTIFQPLEISDIELEREGMSYTFDTVEQLQTRYAGADFYLCIGGDMLASFTSWHRWRELLPMVTLVVAGRELGQTDEMERAMQLLMATGGRLLEAEGPVVPLSSSEIRAGIAAGRNMGGLIPPPADEIVEKNQLYRR